MGIRIERIKPGSPQKNGRHERMHFTLKTETAKPAAFNFLQQQERLERFIKVYNNVRSHQELGGAYPGEVYTPSPRMHEPAAGPDYPFHDRTVRVTPCGRIRIRICIGKRRINLSHFFAGQMLGLGEVEDGIWLVSFMRDNLGFFDKKGDSRRTITEPIRTGESANHVIRMDREIGGGR